MKSHKILFIDTETGGLDPVEHSLLSVAFVIWENGRIIDDKEILINDGELKASAKALEINGINLEEHSKNALQSEVAILEIINFLNKYYELDEKIVLSGHNIIFDINFFKNFWLTNGQDYNKRFSHRYVDTASILFYLSLQGKVPESAVSSQGAFDFFKIHINKRHSALGDVLATAELFNYLLEMTSTSNKNHR